MHDQYDKLMENKISGGQEKKSAEPPKRKPGSQAKRVLMKLVLVLCLAVLLVCGAAVWGYTLSVNGRNLPQVYVDGVFVGGMTPEETDTALREAKWDAYENERLAVSLPAGAGFEVDYLRSGAALSREQAVAAAAAYGHDGNVFTNLWRWLVNHISPVDVISDERTLDKSYIRSCIDQGVLNLDNALRSKTPYRADTESAKLVLFKGATGVELDTDALYDAIEKALRAGEKSLSFDKLKAEPPAPNFEQIYQAICTEAESAHYSEQFEVVPEVVGVSFSIEDAVQRWQAAKVGEEVVIPLEITQPQYTAAQLKELLFRDLLGAQMTYYSGSTAERINNIRLAASKLDGLVLLPGESFSYNDTVGKRTQEAGFQYADAYSDGQVVPELGGGICQVSSTLYSAALYSRLKILSRTNHYFKVGYLDYGMDATVSWGQPDFKFRNDRELPIKIAAYVNEGESSLVIEIWGTDFDGMKVKLHHEDTPIYDEEYPDVQIGWNVKTYSDLYDLDGNYLDTSYVSTSVYYFHDENIEWPDGVDKRLSDAFNTTSAPTRDPYM